MNRISMLLLAEPHQQTLQECYRRYRREGASTLTALITLALAVIGWILLRLESPAWQKVRDNHTYWFPQISLHHPRPADALRYLVQSLWLLLIRPGRRSVRRYRFTGWHRLQQGYRQWLQNLPQRLENSGIEQRSAAYIQQMNPRVRRGLFILTCILVAILAILCITQPLELHIQLIFSLLLWGIAMVVRRVPGRLPVLALIVLSLIVSCRYLWWRYSATLLWEDPFSLSCGLLLLGAETYAWVVLVLGYFQSLWPLKRQPVPLPEESATWPTVDMMVPTYNESLDVVKPTIYAALGMDWPEGKLTIYLLDDGNRPEFSAFAQEVGVKYISRPTHEHAKAGNINHALKQASGEFVTIFDCDHVPTRSFLQLTMGWFVKDKQLAMLQTPHHFFSPDPFERNLGRFRKTPNEGTLFYGLVQDGNDMWDATFFCGSCAILRRTALDEIGGIAVETVTEDAHTSLRLHRRGYTSAYIRIPQSAGLATESLSAHVGQRIRWARGMVQIFRLDNPLFGKGLKWSQRLCYTNAMLHFLSGLPRLVFLTAPLAFLLFHAYIIFAPTLVLVCYVLPHIIHANMTNSSIQGRYRHSFWGEVYETVLAWYIARPTVVALLNPHKGKFNVTAKGGLVEQEYLDWVISRPYLFLVAVNVAGLVFGVWRIIYGQADEVMTTLICVLWVLYNMIIIGGAISVAVETKQVRRMHRVAIAMPAAIACKDGHLFPCTLRDYSNGGAGIEMRVENRLQMGEKVWLLLRRGQRECVFPCRVAYVLGTKIGMRLLELSTQQQIDFIQCTFARADTWARWQDALPEDKPLTSLGDVLKLGFAGYGRMIYYASPLVQRMLTRFMVLMVWIVSFVPHRVGKGAAFSPKEAVV